MPNPDRDAVTRLAAPPEASGERLDRFIAARLLDTSRARVQALIRAGLVTVGGRAAGDPGLRLKLGDVIVVTVPPPAPASPAPEAIPLTVVHEDAHLVVIDKPAGLIVHPAAGREAGTLVNALIAHCGESLSGIGGVRRPGIVHRLDKDTSGLLVVAKTDAAHRGLSEQFATHGRDGRLHRAYLGLCWGRPLRPRGRIEASLGRSASNRTKIAVTSPGKGRLAVTHYEIAESFGSASLLRLTLETGRTHQIRVHLAHIGHPLVGDATYGAGFKSRIATLPARARDAIQALGRQALHAAELGFVHPVTGRALSFASPMPPDLARVLDALRSSEREDATGRRRAR